jgi:hypothetical protein
MDFVGEYTQGSPIQDKNGYSSTEKFVASRKGSLLKEITIPEGLKLGESLKMFEWDEGPYEPPVPDKLILGSFLVTLFGDEPFPVSKFGEKFSIDEPVTQYALRVASEGGRALSGKESISINRTGYVEVDRDIKVQPSFTSPNQPDDDDYELSDNDEALKAAFSELGVAGFVSPGSLVTAGVFHFPKHQGTGISVENLSNEQIAQIFFPPTPQNPARATANSWAPDYSALVRIIAPVTGEGLEGATVFTDYQPFLYKPSVYPGRDIQFNASTGEPVGDSTPSKTSRVPISFPLRPQNAIINVYSRELLLSWDWNDSDYCKSQLLALGFKQEDISFRAPLA